MLEALQKEVFNALLASPIPGIIGPASIYYRVAGRDPVPPYVIFNLRMKPVSGEVWAMEAGELIIDIWDYETTNDRTLHIAELCRQVFSGGHIFDNPDLAAVRFRYTDSREAPVEGNRSNRRSEDERIFRREVSFSVRSYDKKGADYVMGNLPPEMSNRLIVVPSPAPDGVEVEFTLPSPASTVFYYTVDGTQFTDHALVDPVTVSFPTPPNEGAHVTICYV